YYGGAALNAIHVLMQGLSAVTARDGLLPDQLRVGRTPLSQAEVDGLTSLPKGWEMLDDAGATPLDAKAPEDFYDRTWAEPSPDERLRVQDIDRAVAAASELYRGLAALG